MLTMDEIDELHEAGLHCPHCTTTNAPQRKFCSKCGAALWEPCLQCGELSAAGETYCGACGANLPEIAAAQVELAKADLSTAAEMKSAFRFQEATGLLTRISKKDHPRLAEYAARAKELISQIAAEKRERRLVAEEACQRAQRCLAASDYDGAARLIDNVPLPLQNDEMRLMRTQIAEQQQNVNTLTEELQTAVQQKRLLELPALVERLLALKPDHNYARSVAAQVQKRLVAAAKKMLAEHRYDQALRLLDQISAPTNVAEFQQLRRQATELAWLDWDLRNGPVIDDTLVAVADRLRRLAPDNASAVRLCSELQHRVQPVKDSRRDQPLPWARPPEQTPLGFPVEWLTGFRRVVCSETLDTSDLLRHPGRFAVACGLALTGIEQAALHINLLPGQEPGMLHRFKRLMQSKHARSAWGIDLGASSLKAVRLSWDGAKQQAVIESAVLIEHAKVLGHAANNAEEERLVAETLKAFLGSRQIKNERICVGLPGRMVLSRQIDLPPVTLAKAPKLVQFEASHQFPVPLDQLAWDYQLLDPSPNLTAAPKTPDEKHRQALLIAVRRTVARPIVDALQRLNVRVDLLQPDFLALHNFLAYDCLASPGDSPSGEAYSVVAAVDIGSDVTNVMVSSPCSVWFRTCGVAGHSFTRALVKEFNLTVAQAEQRKCEPESVERLGDLYDTLSPVFDDLLQEVRRSLSVYAEVQPNRPVQCILGIGGGFSLHGLFRYLRCGR
jgi:type IV pilus assembly protein PilM